MYESPINLIEKQVAFDIEKTIEGEVWKVTKEIGVDVNKEELIKALQYDRDQYERGYYDGLNAHKWIPVSERLPEDHENVLIYLSSNQITIGLYNSHRLPFMDKPIGWGADAPHGWSSDEVVAWMPLPEPYKAEGSDKA